MSFLREKESRLFFVYLIFCSCLVLGAAVFFQSRQTEAVKELLLEQEALTAGALLEQGVPEGVIAGALGDAVSLRATDSEIREAGEALLKKLGHTAEISGWMMPAVAQSTWHVGRQQLAVFSFFLMMSAGGAWFFLQRRERLYDRALSIVSRFSEGDFSEHLPQSRTGSLYQLFAAVDGLAAALQAGMEKEHQGREFLKNSISDISHQLKTPLAALQMYAEIIREETGADTAAHRFSEKSLQSIGRMERLIRMLLQLMRMEAGSIVFERQSCSVRELTDTACAELVLRAKQEEKTIEREGWEGKELVCDPAWTGEAIANLVKNALDHTEAGGRVRLIWESSPSMLRLTVSDDGCGISERDIHHIFKRFYRGEGSCSRQGIGLGLPLAKSIVEGQGGVLTVASQKGAGTSFTISFLTEL